MRLVVFFSCAGLRNLVDERMQEIADVMGIPLGTVKTYLHRARGELKERLADVAF